LVFSNLKRIRLVPAAIFTFSIASGLLASAVLGAVAASISAQVYGAALPGVLDHGPLSVSAEQGAELGAKVSSAFWKTFAMGAATTGVLAAALLFGRRLARARQLPPTRTPVLIWLLRAVLLLEAFNIARVLFWEVVVNVGAALSGPAPWSYIALYTVLVGYAASTIRGRWARATMAVCFVALVVREALPLIVHVLPRYFNVARLPTGEFAEGGLVAALNWRLPALIAALFALLNRGVVGYLRAEAP